MGGFVRICFLTPCSRSHMRTLGVPLGSPRPAPSPLTRVGNFAEFGHPSSHKCQSPLLSAFLLPLLFHAPTLSAPRILSPSFQHAGPSCLLGPLKTTCWKLLSQPHLRPHILPYDLLFRVNLLQLLYSAFLLPLVQKYPTETS